MTAVRQVDDDRKASRAVYDQMKRQDRVVLMTDRLSHYEIKALYGSLDYLVGTRFHSVIFSLTSYVPAIAIEYEHKTRGIMQDLGLLKWVVKFGDVETKTLIDLFKKLLKEQKTYQHSLEKVVPPYVARTREAIGEFKEVLR